jgi:hypothetical protein
LGQPRPENPLRFRAGEVHKHGWTLTPGIMSVNASHPFGEADFRLQSALPGVIVSPFVAARRGRFS